MIEVQWMGARVPGDTALKRKFTEETAVHLLSLATSSVVFELVSRAVEIRETTITKMATGKIGSPYTDRRAGAQSDRLRPRSRSSRPVMTNPEMTKKTSTPTNPPFIEGMPA